MTDNTTIPDGYKKCTKCGAVFPATPEYFIPREGVPDGLRGTCRSCTSARQKQWHKDHPERARDATRRYRERIKADPEKNEEYLRKDRESHRAFHARNRNARNARQRELRRLHPEQYQEYDRRALAKKKSNPEEFRRRTTRYKRNWRRSHPEIVRAIQERRRAQLASAEGNHTAEDIRLIFEQQKGLCWWCSKPVGDDYHVDHRIPLSRGGSNGPENLCISCPSCNTSKHSKMPWEWNGRLL